MSVQGLDSNWFIQRQKYKRQWKVIKRVCLWSEHCLSELGAANYENNLQLQQLPYPQWKHKLRLTPGYNPVCRMKKHPRHWSGFAWKRKNPVRHPQKSPLSITNLWSTHQKGIKALLDFHCNQLIINHN